MPNFTSKRGSTSGNSYSRRYLFFRTFVLLAGDTVTIVAAFLGAFFLRFPNHLWGGYIGKALPYLPVSVAIGLAAFAFVGMYRMLWRYASVDAIVIITLSTFIATAIPAVILIVWGPFQSHWAVFVIQWMLLLMLVGSGRFSIRILRNLSLNKSRKKLRNLLIYGAGDSGEMIARDLLRASTHDFRLVGFIDDDRRKRGRSMHSVPVLGSRDQVAQIVNERKIDEIVLAMPSLSGSETRSILNCLHSELRGKVNLKTVPAISELIDGRITFQQVRKFDIRDLLRRKQVELDVSRVDRLVRGKCILVSGAGGSIGAEVCRQVIACKPAKLILFDISEPSLYEFLEEISEIEIAPDMVVESIVGDITSRALLEGVFSEHSPQIVFHAAAYKHVPLMEMNPWSAVNNNIRGTRVLASVAADYHVERFVMISTDKAVRPTSVMGATKRICENLVQAQPHSKESIFCAVRFGNVMGSSGSVIPKFERQIQAGGPVTVTDPRVTRYFMLTSEAVQLVMQAATLDIDDAIYILDMGEPVNISDIARDMILLSGLEPDKHIRIEYTGLRPGEKMNEELYHNGKGARTVIEKIRVDDSLPCNSENYLINVDLLLDNCFSYSRKSLLKEIASLVPDYTGAKPPLTKPIPSEPAVELIGENVPIHATS